MTQLSAFGAINGYQRFKVHLSHSAMIVRLLSSKERGPDLPLFPSPSEVGAAFNACVAAF